MRRLHRLVSCVGTLVVPTAVRHCATSTKKYDLFGYEVSTNTQPWMEKIKKVQYYDEAGDLMVQMNLQNTPPDLATYNTALQRIYECEKKQKDATPGESKVCAMLDIIEEMEHRNKIKSNGETWSWVMKACVQCGNFRVGRVVEACMAHDHGGCPEDLVRANEANAQKATAEEKEHPGNLSKQTALFDTVSATT